MVIYSWVILKEIITNPQRPYEKLLSNDYYKTYLSPLLIAHLGLQAALFISSWSKLKYRNDKFHCLTLYIRGQIFAQREYRYKNKTNITRRIICSHTGCWAQSQEPGSCVFLNANHDGGWNYGLCYSLTSILLLVKLDQVHPVACRGVDTVFWGCRREPGWLILRGQVRAENSVVVFISMLPPRAQRLSLKTTWFSLTHKSHSCCPWDLLYV